MQDEQIVETPVIPAEIQKPSNGEDQAEKPIPETFTEDHPEGLTPQEQVRFKKMQGEYTKKTQAIFFDLFDVSLKNPFHPKQSQAF